MGSKYLKILIFILLSYGLCYLFTIGLNNYLFDGNWNLYTLSLFTPLAMASPLVATFLTYKIYKQKALEELNLKLKFNKYFFISWIFPLVLILINLFIIYIFNPEGFAYNNSWIIERLSPFTSSSDRYALSLHPQYNLPFYFIIFNGLLGGILVSSLMAFGEEIGWRGFLNKELPINNFWIKSLFIGFIWGIWHWPLVYLGYNYPSYAGTWIGVLAMGITCSLLSPIISYLTQRSGHIWSAAVFHGSFNGLIGLTHLFTEQGHDLWEGFFGASGWITLIIINIILYFYTKPSKLLFKGHEASS